MDYDGVRVKAWVRTQYNDHAATVRKVFLRRY